jgi:hypothetical protein
MKTTHSVRAVSHLGSALRAIVDPILAIDYTKWNAAKEERQENGLIANPEIEYRINLLGTGATFDLGRKPAIVSVMT